jgi:RNA polymerase sigma-70 factor, ECF subfamily
MSARKEELRRGVTELLPRLRRFGIALAGTAEDGDDIVQAAIERALAKSDQWQEGTRLDSWLFKIMQNFWRDELRKRRSDAKGQTLVNVTDINSIDGRRVAESTLMLAKTRERFTRLPDEQRLALALVVIDGRSYHDAAEQLEIPIGTLMSRLSRARESLRQMTEADDVASHVGSNKAVYQK